MRATRFPVRADGVAGRVAGFMAHLRLNGFPLGPGETADALAALAAIRATDPAEARHAFRVIAARDAARWARFDALFDAFWFRTGRASPTPARTAPGRTGFALTPAPEEPGSGGAELRGDDGEGRAEAGGEGRLVAVSAESLARTDLRRLTDPALLREAEAVAERLGKALRDRTSRRMRAAARGRIDLRRTLRASIARGGEPIDLHRRKRREPPLALVALVDVSGSMKPHARAFLAFARGLSGGLVGADVWLFHTRLVRVTEALCDRDTLRAADRLTLLAEGFGGGTRIGGALADFAARPAAQALTRRTCLLILSDGYDTGPPDLLAAALARLRRRAGRILWLNPLKGWASHAPAARGIAAALPFLDAHLPAATLADLAALEATFARL